MAFPVNCRRWQGFYRWWGEGRKEFLAQRRATPRAQNCGGSGCRGKCPFHLLLNFSKEGCTRAPLSPGRQHGLVWWGVGQKVGGWGTVGADHQRTGPPMLQACLLLQRWWGVQLEATFLHIGSPICPTLPLIPTFFSAAASLYRVPKNYFPASLMLTLATAVS